jgi:hypothetical protein
MFRISKQSNFKEIFETDHSNRIYCHIGPDYLESGVSSGGWLTDFASFGLAYICTTLNALKHGHLYLAVF